MKSWLFFFVFIVLVWSCQKKESKKIEVPQVALPAPEVKRSEVNDTLYETQFLFTEDYNHRKEQSEFRTGDNVYKAVTESYSLNDSSLVEIFRDTVDGQQVKVRKLRCHNHVYKIRLTKNGKLVYRKQFTKHDFLKLGDDGFIKESAPGAPLFRGVTADGKVLFDIWFGLPDSDFGGISFFSTDLKGNLQTLECYSSTGGNGCDGKVHTSPDSKHYLTCHTLYGPDNYIFNFGKQDMVTASFLTDTTFVALYDYVNRFYNKEKKEWEEEYDRTSDNLIIYHVNGKKLASYRYDGFFSELDYVAPITKLPLQNQLALFNEEAKTIQFISLENPKQSKTILLKDIEKLTKRKKSDTTEVELNGLGTKYFLYATPEALSYYATSNYKEW